MKAKIDYPGGEIWRAMGKPIPSTDSTSSLTLLMPAILLFKSHCCGWIHCPLSKCKCPWKEKHVINFRNPVPLYKPISFFPKDCCWWMAEGRGKESWVPSPGTWMEIEHHRSVRSLGADGLLEGMRKSHETVIYLCVRYCVKYDIYLI